MALNWSATITLVKDAVTVTLPSPRPGYEAPLKIFQSRGRTAGGTPTIYDKGIKKWSVVLELEWVTQAQKDALDSFFHTTALGGVNDIVYNDHLGNAHTALRFDQDTLPWKKMGNERWGVEISLSEFTAGVP